MDFFGTKIVSFKSRIETGPLRLRLCRMRDVRTLYSLFTPEILPEAKESKRSLFSFYRWMKNTFRVIYVIEMEENGDYRIIGFAGLYDMELGQRLRVSLAIFNPEDRGRGYGEKAFNLLLGLLREIGAAEVVHVELLENTLPSLRLCAKLGFKVKAFSQDRLLLEKDQKSH